MTDMVLRVPRSLLALLILGQAGCAVQREAAPQALSLPAEPTAIAIAMTVETIAGVGHAGGETPPADVCDPGPARSPVPPQVQMSRPSVHAGRQAVRERAQAPSPDIGVRGLEQRLLQALQEVDDAYLASQVLAVSVRSLGGAWLALSLIAGVSSPVESTPALPRQIMRWVPAVQQPAVVQAALYRRAGLALIRRASVAEFVFGALILSLALLRFRAMLARQG